MLDNLISASSSFSQLTSSEGSESVLSSAGKVPLSRDKIYGQFSSVLFSSLSSELSDATSEATPVPRFSSRHDRSRTAMSRH